MAVSLGTRQALGVAVSWVFAAGCAAFSLLHYDEIKALARDWVGASEAADVQAAPRNRTASDARPIRQGGAGRVVEVKAGSYGHYFANVEINGRGIEVMVDSGASIVALTYDDARRAGVAPRQGDYTHQISTANGLARIAPITLERVSIGDITVRNVSAAVSEPGKLATSLLGMSFLNRLQRVDMRGGVLILQE